MACRWCSESKAQQKMEQDRVIYDLLFCVHGVTDDLAKSS